MRKVIVLLFVALLSLAAQTSQARSNSSSFEFGNPTNVDYHVSPIRVTTLQDFKQIIACGTPCVVFFTADWCGPCKIVSPQIVKLADEHPNIIFLIVDVDNLPAIPTEYDVKSLPTVIFLDKTGNEVGRSIGVKSMQTYEEYIIKINS